MAVRENCYGQNPPTLLLRENMGMDFNMNGERTRYNGIYRDRLDEVVCSNCGGRESDHSKTTEKYCPVPPTPKMVERLKEQWRKDACWDIEKTVGYEDYHDELLAFRLKTEKETKERLQKDHERYASKKCPMAFMHEASADQHCVVEQCAWWDGTEFSGRCAVYSIARNTERE